MLSSFSDLNLLDWSVNNQLAVCLAGSLYLWNASTGDIQQLFQMEGPEEYICSVSWINEGNYLAVGGSSGEVQVGSFVWLSLSLSRCLSLSLTLYVSDSLSQPYIPKWVTWMFSVILRFVAHRKEHWILIKMMQKWSRSVHWFGNSNTKKCRFEKSANNPFHHITVNTDKVFVCSNLFVS